MMGLQDFVEGAVFFTGAALGFFAGLAAAACQPIVGMRESKNECG